MPVFRSKDKSELKRTMVIPHFLRIESPQTSLVAEHQHLRVVGGNICQLLTEGGVGDREALAKELDQCINQIGSLLQALNWLLEPVNPIGLNELNELNEPEDTTSAKE